MTHFKFFYNNDTYDQFYETFFYLSSTKGPNKQERLSLERLSRKSNIQE
jgi:hypothetical protein